MELSEELFNRFIIDLSNKIIDTNPDALIISLKTLFVGCCKDYEKKIAELKEAMEEMKTQNEIKQKSIFEQIEELEKLNKEYQLLNTEKRKLIEENKQLTELTSRLIVQIGGLKKENEELKNLSKEEN